MSAPITKTSYLVYQYPGLLVSDESVVEIHERNPQNHAARAARNVFGFYYFDIYSTVIDVEGKQVMLTSDRQNISSLYYIDAEVYDAEDAIKAFPLKVELADNIRFNHMERVVRTRMGNFQEFKPMSSVLISSN